MTKMAEGGFSKEEAAKVAEALGLDLSDEEFTLAEWTAGLNEELEHTDVTDGDSDTTGKITLAHLKEDPKYYTKLKGAMEKGLLDSSSSAIIEKDNIPMLTLPEEDMNKSFEPEEDVGKGLLHSDDLEPDGFINRFWESPALQKKAIKICEDYLDMEEKLQSKNPPKDGWEKLEKIRLRAKKLLFQQSKKRAEADMKHMEKLKKVSKGLEAGAELRKACRALKDKEMDLKKKAESKEEEEDTSKGETSEFTIEKALRAIAVAGLGRRARLAAAYQLGQSLGQQAEEKPDETVTLKLNVGTDRVAPPHEPPVVPVRRVATPLPPLQPCEVMKSCEVHGYFHKSTVPCPLCVRADVQEAGPLWRRR